MADQMNFAVTAEQVQAAGTKLAEAGFTSNLLPRSSSLGLDEPSSGD